MDLIDHEAPSTRLESFPFPTDARKEIRGPDDLTRGEAKAFAERIKNDDKMTLGEYAEHVFIYWALLPATSWNLGRGGERIPLNLETLDSELTKGDFAALAFDVAKHLYPFMFAGDDDATSDDEPEDDVLDGLDVEAGSQAAEDKDSDPNE